jgi:rhodanese-related sulfurtransferase
VPTITPTEAKELLRTKDGPAVLVDISSSDEFDSVHIDGAQNWPVEEILALDSRDQVPEELKGKRLLLLCAAGVTSKSAAMHLAKLGAHNVVSVRGGTQEWIAGAAGPEGDVFDRFASASGRTWPFPFRHSSRHEQLAAVVSGFGIKVSYTLLSLVLVIVLWRSKSPDLAALRWAMIFFFLGENCCAMNYLVFNDKSYLFEYLHSFGMLLSFSFVTYALFEGTDRRILMLSEPGRKCAALGLCRRCIKYEDVCCGLKRTFFMIIPALIVVALLPLGADWHTTSYNTTIFGTFYNYSHRLIYQQHERIYCPIVAIAALTVSLLILAFKRNNPLPPAKIFFAAGVGPLGFGTFRTTLAGLYSENLVWFNFWEEATELLFVVGVCFILWVFRAGIFKSDHP